MNEVSFLHKAHYPGPNGERPPESHLQAYESYMSQDWLDLAAIAWAHFERDGRGLIRLSMRKLQETLEEQEGDVLWDIPTPYHTAGELDDWTEELGLPQPFVEELCGLVENYDPKASVVVVLGRADGGASLYVLSSNPSPPAALKLKDRTN